MAERAELDFSFSFGADEQPEALLAEARKSIAAAHKTLTGGIPRNSTTDPANDSAGHARRAADELLADLQDNVAEFSSAQPHLIALTQELFAQQNAVVTPDVEQLFSSHKLYWLRVPYTLQAKADHRFQRVELAIELNPGAGAAQRPRVEAALPTSEFTNLTEAVVEFNLGIDESLQFAAKVGSPPLPTTPVSQGGAPTAGASASATQSGKIRFVAGPFQYRVRKAEIERSTLGTEKVFWRISNDAKLEQPPELVAVIAVPKTTTKLEISAALQAYSSPAVLQMTLGNFFKYLGSRLRTFFTSGAPKRNVQVWDLSGSL